jgi:hypothetical protein
LIEAKDYEQQRVNRKKNPTKSKHYAIIFKKLTYHAAPIISLTDTVDVNKEVAEEKEITPPMTPTNLCGAIPEEAMTNRRSVGIAMIEADLRSAPHPATG